MGRCSEVAPCLHESAADQITATPSGPSGPSGRPCVRGQCCSRSRSDEKMPARLRHAVQRAALT